MPYTFNATQLSICVPSNKKYLEWYDVLQSELPRYSIDSKLRVAGFLAQCGHESDDFTVLIENLNYSSTALISTFKKYFKDQADADGYHRQPERIANRVYADRLGNGPESSGDGWKFRGRGIIQITGKENYQKISQFLFQDDRLLDNPTYLTTVLGAVQSACWYWRAFKCNDACDAGDNKRLTYIINGGYNGLDDRNERYTRAMQVL